MIDWGRVRELRGDIGAEDFDEVVDLFLCEAAEVIERIMACPDAKARATDLHFLKGSARNMGFHALGALCQEAERSGDMDLCRQIPVCFLRARTDFLAGLPEKLMRAE